MELAIGVALVFVVLPSIFGWFMLLRGLFALWSDRRKTKREARLLRELDAELTRQQIAAHRTAYQRRRELRELASTIDTNTPDFRFRFAEFPREQIDTENGKVQPIFRVEDSLGNVEFIDLRTPITKPGPKAA